MTTERKIPNIAKAKAKKSATNRSVELARTICNSLAHNATEKDENFNAFLTSSIGGRVTTEPLESKIVESWIRSHCVTELGDVWLTREVFALVLTGLKTQALVHGPKIDPAVRVAEHDGKIFYDLGEGPFVRIAKGSVELIEAPPAPVRFRLFPGMTAQVRPTLHRDLDAHRQALREFRRLLKINSEEDWALLQLAMASGLNPTHSTPMLKFRAQSGSGKSTIARAVKLIIDPSTPASASTNASDDPKDIIAAAVHCQVLFLDNASKIHRKLSDLLCQLITGTSIKLRELFTTADLRNIELKRCIIIASIDEIGTMEDLASRTIPITLESLQDSERIAEDEFFERFDSLRAEVFGALCYAVSEGLGRVDSIRAQRPVLPRMADFGLWALACAPYLDIEHPEKVLEVFAARQRDAQVERISENPLVELISRLSPSFPLKLTPTGLFELVYARASQDLKRSLPDTVRGFGRELEHQRANLRQIGIGVERFKSGQNYIHLFNLSSNATNSNTTQSEENNR